MSTVPDPDDAAQPDPARGGEHPAEAGPDAPATSPTGSPRARLPEDVDAAFAAIVAAWAGTDAPRWPDDGPAATGDGTTERASGVGLATPPEGAPRADPRGVPDDPHGAAVGPVPADASGLVPGPPPAPRDGGREPASDAADDDDHFDPPEPPPLPRVGLSSLLGLLLLVAGVVLLAVPGLLGGSLGLGIVPGLLAMTAGLGWLVFGLRRPSERDGGGPDEHGVL